jgi:hypothetical protein
MAKKRPSVQKRQREIDKAAKAAQKRERRQNRTEAGDSPPTDGGSEPKARSSGADE